jgi:hypothetical protein
VVRPALCAPPQPALRPVPRSACAPDAGVCACAGSFVEGSVAWVQRRVLPWLCQGQGPGPSPAAGGGDAAARPPLAAAGRDEVAEWEGPRGLGGVALWAGAHLPGAVAQARAARRGAAPAGEAAAVRGDEDCGGSGDDDDGSGGGAAHAAVLVQELYRLLVVLVERVEGGNDRRAGGNGSKSVVAQLQRGLDSTGDAAWGCAPGPARSAGVERLVGCLDTASGLIEDGPAAALHVQLLAVLARAGPPHLLRKVCPPCNSSTPPRAPRQPRHP